VAKSAFATIKYQPYQNRSEHVNIGLIVWKTPKEPQVYLARNLRKAASLKPSTQLHSLKALEQRIPELLETFDGLSIEEQSDFIATLFPNIQLSSTTGQIQYDDDFEYQEKIKMMLNSVVEPEKKMRADSTYPRNRLSRELEKTFNFYRWLGKGKADIDKRLIIPRYPLSSELDMIADFAYSGSNKEINIIETIDLQINISSAKRNEVRSKALLYDFAKQLDKGRFHGISIVAGAQDNKDAEPLIKLLSRYANDIIYYESSEDMERFMQYTSKAIDRPIIAIPI